MSIQGQDMPSEEDHWTNTSITSGYKEHPMLASTPYAAVIGTDWQAAKRNKYKWVFSNLT